MSLADDVLSSAPGTVTEYAGVALPAGYLWANGAAASRTTYARLFNAIVSQVTGVVTSGNASITSVSQDLTLLPTSLVGAPVSGPGIPAGATIASIASNVITLSGAATSSVSGAAIVIAPHGVGDGSTTFNVPDRRGRAGVGHDKMGAGTAAGRLTSGGGGVNGALLGNAAGIETQTLTVAQMPAHSHTDSGHAHASGAASNQGGNASGYPNSGADIWHAGAGGTSTATANLQNTGGGGAHPNVQPSIVMNYIIKT
jgi:microcystin-dependent protein